MSGHFAISEVSKRTQEVSKTGRPDSVTMSLTTLRAEKDTLCVQMDGLFLAKCPTSTRQKHSVWTCWTLFYTMRWGTSKTQEIGIPPHTVQNSVLSVQRCFEGLDDSGSGNSVIAPKNTQFQPDPPRELLKIMHHNQIMEARNAD